MLQSLKVLQQVLQYFQIIATSIAKYQKNCNKYWKISKVLQLVLQEVLKNIESIAIIIEKFQKYCNTYYKISKVLQYLLQNLKVL